MSIQSLKNLDLRKKLSTILTPFYYHYYIYQKAEHVTIIYKHKNLFGCHISLLLMTASRYVYGMYTGNLFYNTGYFIVQFIAINVTILVI